VVAYRDSWLRRNLPAGADGQVARVARRFGLVAAAGELTTGLGILPWPEGEAEKAATRCFNDWLAARGGIGSAELRDGIAQVRAFLEAHGSSRFEAAWPREIYKDGSLSDDTADAIRKTVNRAGFRRLENDGRGGRWEYYVLPEAWRQEVCKGLDAKAIAQAMADRKWLRPDGSRLTPKPHIPGHGSTRVYVVTADFLSPPDQASPSARTVF
jgi:uncharacterized protein (DUF927 family)